MNLTRLCLGVWKKKYCILKKAEAEFDEEKSNKVKKFMTGF